MCYMWTGGTAKLVVDHCHASGKIRGLLCDLCNRGIGHFNDSVELLYKAIKYLELHYETSKQTSTGDPSKTSA